MLRRHDSTSEPGWVSSYAMLRLCKELALILSNTLLELWLHKMLLLDPSGSVLPGIR